jgi:hypothetical protein
MRIMDIMVLLLEMLESRGFMPDEYCIWRILLLVRMSPSSPVQTVISDEYTAYYAEQTGELSAILFPSGNVPA